MPKVSVIIPSYNHEKYVAEALLSVLEQTFHDFEIIITDDASSDGTVNEIRKFTDSRIRLFVFNQNQGACVAANHCIQHANGDYVAMLSSDDIFLPDKLRKQVRFLDDHADCAAVFSYAQIIDEEGNEFTDKNHFYYDIFNQPNRTRHEWLHYFFHKANCLCHPSVLIRKKCYADIGYYDPRFAQLPDYDYWIRLCLKYDIHVLPENLIKFRIRRDEANTSAARPDSITRHELELSIVLENYFAVTTMDEFLKIFPGANTIGPIAEDDMLPFFLAKLALEHNSPSHELFGIQTLFKLLANKNTADILNRDFAFTFTDLIALTGSCDVFGMKKVQDLCTRIADLETRSNIGSRMAEILNVLLPPSSARRALIKQLKLKYLDALTHRTHQRR